MITFRTQLQRKLEYGIKGKNEGVKNEHTHNIQSQKKHGRKKEKHRREETVRKITVGIQQEDTDKAKYTFNWSEKIGQKKDVMR